MYTSEKTKYIHQKNIMYTSENIFYIDIKIFFKNAIYTYIIIKNHHILLKICHILTRNILF